MTHRWNQSDADTRTIHCAVVEVPVMTDPFDAHSSPGFRDLVPWADPYIASLINKLRRSIDGDEAPRGELPPPLDSDPLRRDSRWSDDWRPRGSAGD